MLADGMSVTLSKPTIAIMTKTGTAPAFSARIARKVIGSGLLEAIDERTAFVSLSHVLFKTSYIMDAAAIVAHAHASGAPQEKQKLDCGGHSVPQRSQSKCASA